MTRPPKNRKKYIPQKWSESRTAVNIKAQHNTTQQYKSATTKQPNPPPPPKLGPHQQPLNPPARVCDGKQALSGSHLTGGGGEVRSCREDRVALAWRVVSLEVEERGRSHAQIQHALGGVFRQLLHVVQGRAQLSAPLPRQLVPVPVQPPPLSTQISVEFLIPSSFLPPS